MEKPTSCSYWPESLVPKAVTSQQASYVYASKADLLNVALFGGTAKEWRDAIQAKPEISGIMQVWNNWWF